MRLNRILSIRGLFRKRNSNGQGNRSHPDHQPICEITPHDLLLDSRRRRRVNGRRANRRHNRHEQLREANGCSNGSAIRRGSIDIDVSGT